MKQKFNYKKDKNEFTKEMLNDTLKYQKKYGFDIGQYSNSWNSTLTIKKTVLYGLF